MTFGNNKTILTGVRWKRQKFDEVIFNNDSSLFFLVLRADDDGPLQQMMSPRTNPMLLEQRIEMIMDELQIGIGVALTVEELCPGGMDATDGIAFAKAFEEAGASFLIASGGTNDFPALKHRRRTQIKDERPDVLLESPEPWLASAAWLVPHVKIPVFAQGEPDNLDNALRLAEQLGLKGIVTYDRRPIS